MTGLSAILENKLLTWSGEILTRMHSPLSFSLRWYDEDPNLVRVKLPSSRLTMSWANKSGGREVQLTEKALLPMSMLFS